MLQRAADQIARVDAQNADSAVELISDRAAVVLSDQIGDRLRQVTTHSQVRVAGKTQDRFGVDIGCEWNQSGG